MMMMIAMTGGRGWKSGTADKYILSASSSSFSTLPKLLLLLFGSKLSTQNSDEQPEH